MYFDRISNLYLQTSSWIQNQIPLRQLPKDVEFNWDATPAKPHFVWHNCFGDFKCARLQVPMDWLGTSEEVGKTVELAVIKVEATVPITHASYGGAVVLNPGGPGVSGVGQILRGGHYVRTVLSAGPEDDASRAKHFDIIGFDPRGINNTRPFFTCFPNHLAAATWAIEDDARGPMDASDVAFDHMWASRRALAEGCSKRAAAEGIGKHMDTAPVARDIIEIFERHGEWREREALRLLAATPLTTSIPDEEHERILERTKYTSGAEMVQYWGFSYGSILGATLSAMYPDRIKRAVLDGVGDSHDYMAAGWTTNLQDTDKLYAKLAEHCYNGGSENCALWDEAGPAAISKAVQKAFSVLRNNPISIPGDDTHGPEIGMFADLKKMISEIVNHALKELPMTAQVLSELQVGKADALIDWKRNQRPTSLGQPLSKQCIEDGAFSASCHSSGSQTMIQWDAIYAVSCADGASRLHESKEEFREYADKLIAQSSLIGAGWAALMLPCTAWHARAHWRYEGDFRSKTAHPILFVGNTLDPVTPLRNALKMAKGFDGAGILHLDSEGHCSYGSVSMCSGRSIREYFQSGLFPGHEGRLEGWSGVGSSCKPDRVPFDGYEKGSLPDVPEGESDVELWNALVGLNQNWP